MCLVTCWYTRFYGIVRLRAVGRMRRSPGCAARVPSPARRKDLPGRKGTLLPIGRVVGEVRGRGVRGRPPMAGRLRRRPRRGAVALRHGGSCGAAGGPAPARCFLASHRASPPPMRRADRWRRRAVAPCGPGAGCRARRWVRAVAAGTGAHAASGWRSGGGAGRPYRPREEEIRRLTAPLPRWHPIAHARPDPDLRERSGADRAPDPPNVPRHRDPGKPGCRVARANTTDGRKRSVGVATQPPAGRPGCFRPADRARDRATLAMADRDGTLSPTRGRIRTSGNDRGPTGPPILQTSRATAIRGNQGATLRAPTRPTAASGRVGVATQPPAGRPGCFRPADRARDRATLAMADRDGTLSPTRGRIRTSGNDRGPTGPPILQTSRATAIRGNQGAKLPAGQRRHTATRSKGGAPGPPRDRSPRGPTSGC